MRKLIITICLVGSILIILDSLQASHWLVLLLFVGVIPGTDTSMSPIDIMAASSTAITIIILRLTIWPRIRSFFFTQPTQQITNTKRTARRAV